MNPALAPRFQAERQWRGVTDPHRCHEIELARIWRLLYLVLMTQAVERILGEVERLSEPERRELRLDIVERVPMSRTPLLFAVPNLKSTFHPISG